MLFEKQIEKVYRGNVFMRKDVDGSVFYFSPSDFNGLICEAFPFKSFAGVNLSGYVYYYGEQSKTRLLVFDHGMGAGHRAYMKEIELLARNGYTVFAYDHTGCVESGGDSTNGLSQSLCDLDCAIKTIKGSERFKGMSLSVIGHSWGGYSTMNIVSIHPEITHIVALAGFVSVKRMIKQSFNGIIRGYAKPMYELESKINPAHSYQDAAETLKNSSVKALLIYSDNDPIVNINHHYRILEEQLKDKENVTLMLVSGKKHNPNFTVQALEYKDKFFADLKKAKKAKLLERPEQKAEFIAKYDWHKMTEQDEKVWAIILEHLAK